ncbi:hypothetical protein [Leifsonia sp. SIMBA_070]|uniref:hypothetical protein n=1 Tax=Leifsonia sp. SIMBA_070 TaxID=3085810 RepID=UPI0039782DE7
MKIEVLHIGDCPNWETAGGRVKEALAHLGDTVNGGQFPIAQHTRAGRLGAVCRIADHHR